MSYSPCDLFLGGIIMAEAKQYIVQEQASGAVHISEDVIASIVSHAVKDVEGVAGLSVKTGSDIAELVGKKNWGKGIKVVISEDDTLAIDCNINVLYGQNIVTVANAAQDAILNAIDSMVGIKATCVNVNVCGIVRQ